MTRDACGWCKKANVGSCAAIDLPNGGSSYCLNAQNQPGLITKQCAGCQSHGSCVDCQAGLHSCFWCPEEQMCLSRDTGTKCRGLSTLPGSCFDCSTVASSCETCSDQPDCVWCKGTQTCVTPKACSGGAQGSCESACAQASTCTGCQQKLDCVWSPSGCVPRLNSGLIPLVCPPTSAFDGASFAGGIILTIGLGAIGIGGYFAYQWHRRRHGGGGASHSSHVQL